MSFISFIRGSLVLAIGCVTLVPDVQAQFKCTSASGAVSFQQTPCGGSDRRAERLDIRPAAGPSVSSPPPDPLAVATPSVKENVDVRMAKQMERERLIREKEAEIVQFSELMARRSALMEQELASLRARKMKANNNLAGATLEQSISIEMSTVVEKYKVQQGVDGERLKAMSVELKRLKEVVR